MKPIKVHITFLLLITWAFILTSNAQENLNLKERARKEPTFQFKAKPFANGDSLHKFYCMMRKADLLNFTSITVKYNNKSKTFQTKDLLKYKSFDYSINRDLILFNINEKLDVPFVTLVGEDNQGKKYNLLERNSKGEITDPSEETAKWEKAVTRVDSMDFVRRFDNVFKGRDGKPRCKLNGKTYIIKRASIIEDQPQ